VGESDEARRFTVQGRVQGVGFRWFVRQRARGLGVGGFVRNCDDGSVLVEARGAADRLDVLAAALRVGPAGARVTNVEQEAIAAPLGTRLMVPFELHR